jgi:hypothetical protein
MLVLLAVSDWGLAVGIGFVLLIIVMTGYVVIQGTRIQLHWRKRVEEGDVEAIEMLLGDEVNRWKTARTPKGVEPSVWRGVQSAELVEATPESVRVSATAEGQYAAAGAERREVSGLLEEGMKLSARLADMVLWDVPNVRLPYVQVDVYGTFRDATGSAQRCVLTTTFDRETAGAIDWDDMAPAAIVARFNGRYALDERGNPLPIDVAPPRAGRVPAAFYRDP